jgi:hypothetical protein
MSKEKLSDPNRLRIPEGSPKESDITLQKCPSRNQRMSFTLSVMLSKSLKAHYIEGREKYEIKDIR